MDRYVTELPPVSELVRPDVDAAANDETRHLRALTTTMLEPGRAADLLGCANEGLIELVRTGVLDAVVVGGEVYVPTGQAQRHVVAQLARGAQHAMELRAQARLALRLYLAEHPATGDWDCARTERRPLVCGRRGKVHSHHGIAHHAVVLNPAWLGTWAPQVHESHPELRTLPVGSVLRDTLAELAGVHEVRHAVALDAPRGSHSHRITGWLRLDPREWPVLVPDELRARIDDPTRVG